VEGEGRSPFNRLVAGCEEEDEEEEGEEEEEEEVGGREGGTGSGGFSRFL